MSAARTTITVDATALPTVDLAGGMTAAVTINPAVIIRSHAAADDADVAAWWRALAVAATEVADWHDYQAGADLAAEAQDTDGAA